MEFSPHAVLVMNSSGVVEAANPKFIETTGYESKELVGKTLAEIYFKAPIGHREIWDRIAIGKENYLEWENKKKNGEKYWVRSSILSVRDENGVTTHILGIFEDISEQKQAESHLNEIKMTNKWILNISKEGIFTMDGGGTITSFNRQLEKLLGYDSIEIIGQHITEIFPSFANFYSDLGKINFKSYGDLIEIKGHQKNGADLKITLMISEIKLANRTVYAGLVRNLLN